MAAQKGKDLLIKVSSDGTAVGTMTAIAGLRSPSVTINGEAPDVTTADSANRFRELLAGAGVRSVEVSGSGIFQDDAAIEDLRGHVMGGTHAYLEVVGPDWGEFAGLFHVSSLELSGDHDGEVGFTVSLASAGEITWAAA